MQESNVEQYAAFRLGAVISGHNAPNWITETTGLQDCWDIADRITVRNTLTC